MLNGEYILYGVFSEIMFLYTNQMLRRLLNLFGIFKEKRPPLTPANSRFRQESHIRDFELEDILIEVAQEFDDINRFKKAAKNISSRLEFNRAKELTRYFHNNPPEPDTLKSKTSKYGYFGVWMNICQNSVFEILFNYKEQAIPILYSIGFGEYDWTQYKAIDVLCRIAIDGIQTKKIVKDIGDEILNFRYEAAFPSVESISKIPSNEEVQLILLKVFEEYSKNDPIDGLHILQLSITNYPDFTKSKLAFIKNIAQGKGIENRSPLLDGAVLSIDPEGNEGYFIGGEKIDGNFEETHRVNATILYYLLDKRDNDINELMNFWERNIKEDSLRNKIKDLRNQRTEI
ncbi:MAG: hypothetical protein J7604_12410 [Sporocytophaga sp.]|uniref:hypothetical protein n=1 Tax=Sporocytophaga sp. TaxID=2231183 RepID=UPI001B228C3E|nr:hypothetical protein [Sporocytophaga sp.]MBO9701007.1 hypothetical protein [Sporocytophaga sp.]